MITSVGTACFCALVKGFKQARHEAVWTQSNFGWTLPLLTPAPAMTAVITVERAMDSLITHMPCFDQERGRASK